MTKKTDSTVDNATRERVPFGGHRRRLAVHQENESYVYRWFNDTEDRLQRAKAAGYEFVTKEEAGDIGDKDASNTKSLDSYVSKRLRNFTTYLMKIRREFWEEDRLHKDQVADNIDEAIKMGGSDKLSKSYGLDVTYRR